MMLLRAFAALLALTLGASAQVGIGNQPNFAQLRPAPSGFQGVGDIQSGWVAYYGMRAYNAAYAASGTNPGIQVCDTATGLTCSTINILTTGYVDRATAVASSACAVQCFASSMTDQTGNGHTMTGTLGHAPIVLFAGCPATFQMCLQFTVASNLRMITASLTQAQPYTFASVAERNGNFAASNGIIGFSGGNVFLGFTSSANTIGIYGGTNFVTQSGVADSSLHSLFAVFNGASSILSFDGTSNTTSATPGASGASGVSMWIGDDANGDPAASLWYEGGMIGSALSTGTLSGVSSNMHGTSGWNF